MGHTMTKQSWEWKKSEQEEFRLYLVSQERSENTVEKYLRDVRRFCAHIGKDTIGDIEREAAILQTMASTGVRVSELPFITAEAVRELVEMYSEALSVLDANTVKYMVEQQQEEIERQRGELIQKKNEIDTLKKAQEQKDAMLARQENTITCQEEEIARLKAQLAAKESAEA